MKMGFSLYLNNFKQSERTCDNKYFACLSLLQNLRDVLRHKGFFVSECDEYTRIPIEYLSPTTLHVCLLGVPRIIWHSEVTVRTENSFASILRKGAAPSVSF